jgi:hypothetical protein
MCEDSPFPDQFPYHTDSDATTEYLVEGSVTRRDHLATIAHDISQKAGWAVQSAGNGADNLLYSLWCQSTLLRNFKDGC